MRIIAILMRSAAEPWIGEFAADALAERADVEVALAQLRDVAPPLEDGLDVAVLARELDLTRRGTAVTPAKRSKYVSMNSFASAFVILSCRDSACAPCP